MVNKINSYSIRRLRLEDIVQAEEIDREAFPTMLPPPNYKREFDNKLAHYVVACDDKKGGDCVVGFAGFWLLLNEGHIVNIVVRESHRRCGVGELLIMNLIKVAISKGAKIITLEVRKSNKNAQSLYKKYGFTPKGIRRAYYLDNREDAIIMTVDDTELPAFVESLDRLEKEFCKRRGLNTCLFEI